MSDMDTADNSGIRFKGRPVSVKGRGLRPGDMAPSFELTDGNLEDLRSESLHGKPIVLSTVPSLDTPVCAAQTERFNSEAKKLSGDTVILTVSRDLPFAQTRWCREHSVEGVRTASDHKHRSFGEAYGVEMPDLGLLARAVFVIDRSGRLVHVEYVQEITREPDYDRALDALRGAEQGS